MAKLSKDQLWKALTEPVNKGCWNCEYSDWPNKPCNHPNSVNCNEGGHPSWIDSMKDYWEWDGKTR